jgi:hypothetical protein
MLFDNVINESAISNMSAGQLKAVSGILSAYGVKPRYKVTDGVTTVTIVYSKFDGLYAEDAPTNPNNGDHYSIGYWDEYADLISYAHDVNPRLSIAGAWVEDMDGNELIDDYDD